MRVRQRFFRSVSELPTKHEAGNPPPVLTPSLDCRHFSEGRWNTIVVKQWTNQHLFPSPSTTDCDVSSNKPSLSSTDTVFPPHFSWLPILIRSIRTESNTRTGVRPTGARRTSSSLTAWFSE